MNKIIVVLDQCQHARRCNAPFGQTEKLPSVGQLIMATEELRYIKTETLSCLQKMRDILAMEDPLSIRIKGLMERILEESL